MRVNLGTTNLNRFVVFSAVVEMGSMSSAAGRLGIAKGAVSTHIQRLEQELGASLLVRTTRKLSLTEAGERFFAACQSILKEAESAIAAASQSSHDLSGSLRITAPVDYGASVVAPVITRLQQENPALRIELISGDRLFDLVEEGVDVAIRLGRLRDSSLQAVRITEFDEWLVAHPTLAKAFSVDDPGEIASLPFVVLSVLPHPTTWQFKGARGAVRSVQFRAAITANTALATRTMALSGLATVLPDFVVREDVKEGHLVRLLPKWRLPGGGVYAVFPPSRYRPQRVRALVSALTEHVRSGSPPGTKLR
jgi:DNA-binding transcriptional LysR family regulator